MVRSLSSHSTLSDFIQNGIFDLPTRSTMIADLDHLPMVAPQTLPQRANIFVGENVFLWSSWPRSFYPLKHEWNNNKYITSVYAEAGNHTFVPKR